MSRIIENETTAQTDTGVSLSTSICVRTTGLPVSPSGGEDGGPLSGAHMRTARRRRAAEGRGTALLGQSGGNAELREEENIRGVQHGANAGGMVIVTRRACVLRMKQQLPGAREYARPRFIVTMTRAQN